MYSMVFGFTTILDQMICPLRLPEYFCKSRQGQEEAWSPEEGGHVMVLQDSFVVVEDGEAGLGLDVEVVGGAGVVEVVNDGGEEESEDLEVGQPRLGRGQ